MLPREKKIPRTLFSIVGKSGHSYHSPSLTLRASKNTTGETTRFSFIVSKKVSKIAPRRNLLKRRGYAVIRKNLTNIKDGFVCVFYFKKEALTTSYSKLDGEIVFLLKQATIFKNG